MKICNSLNRSVSVLALAAVASLATGAFAHPIYRPHKHGVAPIDPNTPVAHVGPLESPYVAPKKTKSGTWTDLTGKLPFQDGPWAPQLLTDGTVLVEDYFTQYWYRLTPDSKGNYEDGTWTKTAAMPSGYEPLFFASQILPDGRMIVNGGEYNAGNSDWTNKGALYDPVANSWTAVSPPSGWSTIGDAESIILPNGSYMLANCCDSSPAEQGIATISGTKVTWTTQDSYYYNDEEGWTALPGGNVLTVDVWNTGSNYNDYEIYNPTTGVWSLAGQTAQLMSDDQIYEIGPGVLTPLGGTQGSIVQFSGAPATGYNNILDLATSTWSVAPVMQYKNAIYDVADGPAATLPDGNVLVESSPGYFAAPSHFWEFSVNKKNKATATQVSDPAQAPNTAAGEGNLLVLPTGQVLWVNSQAQPNEVALYTPTGKPNSAWAPVISAVQTTLTVGSTGNTISGTNFNGFSLGGAYGDDAQAASNFPLVRITNKATGDVCFGRSYDFSTMGVWTQGTTNAVFDIPTTCETGKSTLQVIVNGIASKGKSVTLNG